MKIDNENYHIQISISPPGDDNTLTITKILSLNEFIGNRKIFMLDIISKNIDIAKYEIMKILNERKKI